ncbi:MAG: hypothetical protein IJN50_02115 [Clostridia bacterium]|nr:hypothetical protein [Clostridia bacterium]
MSKIFYRKRIIADYNIGSPVHKTSIQVDWKELTKRILLFVLAAIIIFFIGVEIHSYASAPQLTVSCSECNWLLFHDENGVLVGKVRSASEDQLEQIKLIKKIVVDPSVNDFEVSSKDAEFFEITISGYGQICFESDNCVSTPSNYNYTLSTSEEDEVFNLMSMEHKFLYDQLNIIICDGTAA